jgi:hypothetical protein
MRASVRAVEDMLKDEDNEVTPLLLVRYLLVTWGVVSSPPCRGVADPSMVVLWTAHLPRTSVLGIYTGFPH